MADKPDYAKPMPLAWKPDRATLTIERRVLGKTISQSMEFPILADGSIYTDMLQAQYDRLRKSVWAVAEEKRLGKA